MSEETVRPAGDVAPVGGKQDGEIGGERRLGREDTGRLLGTTGAEDARGDLNPGGLPGPGLAGIGPMDSQADLQNRTGSNGVRTVPNVDARPIGPDDATDPGAADLGPEGQQGQADATDWGGAPAAGKPGSGLHTSDSKESDSAG
ncbi:MAG TPA: hypothetical protein VKT32_13150 [Chthonomonadaceae bacterium]|nr:hypothetical protein [Chthonomonadaceae bacterium]